MRGLTLIEMLLVLLIVGLMMAGILLGGGNLASSRLKKAATSLTGVIRVAYTRASTTSKSVRLVFDFEQKAFWMEEAEQPMLVSSKDPTGNAEATTALEQQALLESERIIKGPTAPRTHFKKVNMGLLAMDTDSRQSDIRSLPSGITFRLLQSTHDDKPKTGDRAYLYFWPGGQTEKAVIQLRIGNSTDDSQTMTLVVAPLTGNVAVKSGPVELTIPTNDGEASDREDHAF